MSEVKLSKPIAILSARVAPEVYSILEEKAAERGVKLSQLVRYILTSAALGLEGVNISNINQPVIVNMNIVNNEVNPTVNNALGDPEITREYVGLLKEDLNRAKAIIKKKDEEIKKMEKLIERIKMMAKAGDIRSIRRLLGV